MADAKQHPSPLIPDSGKTSELYHTQRPAAITTALQESREAATWMKI